jgi:hypothetical protein
MPPTQILDEDDVRRIAREERARPELVHQRTVESVVGLPPRDFLSAAHAGRFPFTKERRLILARTVDVLAYFEERLQRRPPAVAVANDASAEDRALARVGARRVVR